MEIVDSLLVKRDTEIHAWFEDKKEECDNAFQITIVLCTVKVMSTWIERREEVSALG